MDLPPASATLELAYRYAALIDGRRFEQLHTILLPSIRIVGPGFPAMNGLADVQRGMEKLREYDSTFHFVGNQLGAWDDNGVWSGETCCIASHVYTRGGEQWKLDMAIRYQDRIVCQHDGLRFAARELQLAWVQDLPLAMTR